MASESTPVSSEEMVDAAVRVVEDHNPMIDVIHPEGRPQEIARIALGEYLTISNPKKHINTLH